MSTSAVITRRGCYISVASWVTQAGEVPAALNDAVKSWYSTRRAIDQTRDLRQAENDDAFAKRFTSLAEFIRDRSAILEVLTEEKIDSATIQVLLACIKRAAQRCISESRREQRGLQ